MFIQRLVLFVPRHWWHYVESVDDVTVSVNSWIELEEDHEARVGEAVTRAVVCALKAAPSEDNGDVWLNPTETAVPPHHENLTYLDLALETCARRRALTRGWKDRKDRAPVKRDSRGQRTTGPASDGGAAPPPFGPHLVPVSCSEHGPVSAAGPAVDTTSETHLGPRPSLTTNDLLECLLHPDVIARVTQLLLDAHADRGPSVS